jgi:hypothetical protein
MAVDIDLLVYVAKLREPWANSDVRSWPRLCEKSGFS